MSVAALTTAVLIVMLVRFKPQPDRPGAKRILAEHVVDMVSTHELDGTFRYVSPVLAGMVGEYPGSLVGRQPSELAHPDDAAAVNGLWRRAAQSIGAPASVTWRCRRHDGEYAWLES